MTEIYRVFELTSGGHEGEVEYFSKSKEAEKSFYERVTKVAASSESVKANDLDFGEKTLHIHEKPHYYYKKSKLHAVIKVWEKVDYECNEWDITEREFVLDAVQVN